MEDVLEVYTRPYDPERPVVCLDETNKQLVGETKQPQPAEPGQPERYDYEYKRNGVSNLFMLAEPLQGWRHVEVTEHRTYEDYAHVVRDLVDVHYPEAAKVVLVQDNLNTHTSGALYETFAPAEAQRILGRLEIHYTPKHGSWLNIAEIEFSLLSRQCLAQRIPDRDTLAKEVSAWEEERNAKATPVNWRFTTEDARIKLKRLYPTIED